LSPRSIRKKVEVKARKSEAKLEGTGERDLHSKIRGNSGQTGQKRVFTEAEVKVLHHS
jgi:hypothetical protein